MCFGSTRTSEGVNLLGDLRDPPQGTVAFILSSWDSSVVHLLREARLQDRLASTLTANLATAVSRSRVAL